MKVLAPVGVKKLLTEKVNEVTADGSRLLVMVMPLKSECQQWTLRQS
jgi:hypothetical protein